MRGHTLIPIERYYRTTLLIERLSQLQSEIAVQAETLYQIADAAELDALNEAERFITSTVIKLRAAEMHVRARCQRESLEDLRAIDRSPERIMQISKRALRTFRGNVNQ